MRAIVIGLILAHFAFPAAAADGDPTERHKACWNWVAASMTRIMEDDPRTPLIAVKGTLLLEAYARPLYMDASPAVRLAVLLDKCDKIRQQSR